jgi:hypothetical protein
MDGEGDDHPILNHTISPLTFYAATTHGRYKSTEKVSVKCPRDHELRNETLSKSQTSLQVMCKRYSLSKCTKF